MYIKRFLERDIAEGSLYFPAVAILGPRQSGKTTLARHMFDKHAYISLEDTDVRKAALGDPRSFLELYRNEFGLIIDEFQYVPDLLSYIQTIVDSEKKQGYFILTGSQNFLMNQAISQSLVGRVSLHTLLPLSVDELEVEGLLTDEVEYFMHRGFYPATFVSKTPHKRLYAQYVRTYLERDVRQLSNVGDLATFQVFLVLCAERVGQLVNFSELGRECRVSDNTIKRWISILEASYIVFLLRPYEKSFGKRFVKSPKLYFYDTGLICYLLKITKAELFTHQKRGNIFESLIISEIVKHFYNKGEEPTIYFWQDKDKHEVDCIIQYGTRVIAIEMKAGRTANSSFFSGLTYWKDEVRTANIDNRENYVVYAGPKNRITGYKDLISWQSVKQIMSFLDEV
ncbi:MAG: ATP-binding protein [bacterium]